MKKYEIKFGWRLLFLYLGISLIATSLAQTDTVSPAPEILNAISLLSALGFIVCLVVMIVRSFEKH